MKKDLNPLFELIRADGSITINKALCHAIGLDETLVYSELLSRYNYFNIREELDEEGYFFNTIDDFERATTLDAKHQKKAIDKLVSLGLIKTKLKGTPAKRHFYIIDDSPMILAWLQHGKDKLKILEEKQKEEIEKSMQRRKERLESKKNQQFGENGETSLYTGSKLVSPNQLGNNTNYNNTNFNNTNSLNTIGGFNPNEVREGTKSTPAYNTSTPFFDFLSTILKSFKSKYKNDIYESFIYYYSKYYETFNEEHIRYKINNCIDIINKLDMLYSIGINDKKMKTVYTDISITVFKDMVDKHFKTNYKRMKHTLMSFLNDDVLKNRYHEVTEKEK